MRLQCVKDVYNKENILIYAKGEYCTLDPVNKVMYNVLGETNDYCLKNLEILLSSFKIAPEVSQNDPVNHPEHYTNHPSGIECIEITKHYDFSIGNAIKYLWRSGLKQEIGLSSRQKEKQDLEKAIWYINQKIKDLSPKEVAKCKECGSTDVEIKAWINPNGNKFCDDGDDPWHGWCNKCEKEVEIEYYEE